MSGILLVLAHPDDESFVGGGTLAYYARRGIFTALMTLTDGQAGRAHENDQPGSADPESLGIVRREELVRAVKILGIHELITPGLPDGALDNFPDQEGIGLIADEIRRLKPDILISFGPEGAASGHPDHQATWRWTEGAFDLAADPAYGGALAPHAPMKHYWITWPDAVEDLRGRTGSETTTILELGKDIDQLKRQAFAEHRTQQDHFELFIKYQEGLAGKEYFHLGKNRIASPRDQETDLFEGIDQVRSDS